MKDLSSHDTHVSWHIVIQILGDISIFRNHLKLVLNFEIKYVSYFEFYEVPLFLRLLIIFGKRQNQFSDKAQLCLECQGLQF